MTDGGSASTSSKRRKPYPVGSPEAKEVIQRIRRQEEERRGKRMNPNGNLRDMPEK